MIRYYSQATGCTYPSGIHNSIPSDADEMSEERFLSVICNPTPGQIRVHDEHGLPYLVDAPQTEPDLAGDERHWRDGELSSLIWIRDRHRDQLEIGAQATISAEYFTELLLYIQALRDWPQSSEFPDRNFRPVAPEWIAELSM